MKQLLFVFLMLVNSLAFAQVTEKDLPGGNVIEREDAILIWVDGFSLENPEQFHELMAVALKASSTYGKNFDALYDLLLDDQLVPKNVELTVSSGERIKDRLGSEFHQRLLDLLNDTQAAKPMKFQNIYLQ